MASSTLNDLLLDEVRDLYDAEKQITKALPKMIRAASDPELKDGLKKHLDQTHGQIKRLEQIFELMDAKAKSKPCKGMRGIIEEGQEAMQEDLSEGLGDAALIGGARRVEHYEMAAYDAARAMAQALKLDEVAQLMQETLKEEVDTDKVLIQLAKRLLKAGSRPPTMTPSGGGRSGGSNSGRAGSSGSGSSSGSKSGKSAAASGSAGQSSKRGSSATSSRASSGRSSSARASQRAGSHQEGHGSQTTTDHNEIRTWAEDRGAHPACVRGTGDKGDIGMIRLDFPGYSGANSLEKISWDEFFEKFDANGLALIYQEVTADGKKSNFNKLISREQGQQSKSAH